MRNGMTITFFPWKERVYKIKKNEFAFVRRISDHSLWFRIKLFLKRQFISGVFLHEPRSIYCVPTSDYYWNIRNITHEYLHKAMHATKIRSITGKNSKKQEYIIKKLGY